MLEILVSINKKVNLNIVFLPKSYFKKLLNKFYHSNCLSFEENWFRAKLQHLFLSYTFLFTEIPKICHTFGVI